MTSDDIERRIETLKQIRDSDATAALELSDSLIQSGSLDENSPFLAEVLSTRGFIFYRMSRDDEARAEYDRLLILARRSNDKVQECNVLNGLGNVAFGQGKAPDAVQYYEQALKIASDAGNRTFESGILGNLSGIYHDYFGMHAVSTDYAYKSYRTGIGTKHAITALIRLGNLAKCAGNPTLSIEYLQRVLDYAKHNNDSFDLKNALIPMGTAHRDLGDIQKARAFFREALEISEKNNYRSDIALIHMELGDCDRIEGNYASSESHFQTAGGMFAALNASENLGSYKLKYANLEIDRSDPRAALLLIAQAEEIFASAGVRLHRDDIHKFYALAYEMEGDWQQVAFHLKEQRKAEGDKNSELFMNNMRDVQIYIATEKDRYERDILQLRAEQLEKDLANSAVSLAAQTELLSKFRDELRHIVREVDEPLDALRKIKEKLKTLPCEQVDWHNFEKEFADVHPQFKSKLLEKFPDLTKQEVKMCQFARLGLRNHQMAQLLCLSERSIEGHRYNLRKKLGLKTEENLAGFLELIR